MSCAARLTLVATLFLFTGCKNQLTGTLTIGGQAFTPTSCRNGEAVGFFGVELSDATGARLRLVNMPTMQPLVYWFAAGAPTPVQFGQCGVLSITRTNTRINNVNNVEGNVALNCGQGPMAATGSVQFSNCH